MNENKLAIRVVSSFTAMPIGAAISFWSNRLDLPVEVSFAPYGQTFQELHQPRPDVDAVAVLIRMEDFLPTGRHDEATVLGAELAAAVASAARRTPSTLFIVAVCPPSPGAAEEDWRREAIDEAAHQMGRQLTDAANVSHIDPADVLQRYAVLRAEDPYADRLGNIPYTPEYFAALGTALMRRLHRRVTLEPKVLVVDGDNTLWDGVLGEDGPTGVRVGLARQEFQNFLIRQREAGRLLCLCTKNDPADVAHAIATVPGMRLGHDDFVRIRADWRPKSVHVRELAEDLDLALDSFVFIDDSPVECAEVRSKCPGVAVLPLPPDASRALQTLRHYWPLDIDGVTQEASRRTSLYREEGLRRHLRLQSPSLAEFIDSLDLTVNVRPATAADRPRMANLTRRTTQFNFTGRPYDAAEIEALPVGIEQHVVEARDRFGDYGNVGLMMSSAAEDALEVDTFLLSCRALGRGVEHRMLAHLGRRALDQGLGAVRLRYVPTARNQPVRQFLDEVGVPESGFVSAADAAQVRYDPDAASDVGPPQPRLPSGGARRLVSRSDVAGATVDLTTADGLRKAIAGTIIDPGESVDDEHVVRRIWAEILELDPNQIESDFRSLGGDSLDLVQLLARLYEKFGVELPVEALLDNEVTVGGVVDLVRLLRSEDAPTIDKRIPWVEA